ncbi:MAG: hypothetical protein FJX51_02080 [Alphaproteobacteria bacterium]|nr:hypothetical protein [Alphaproteobacteria bacterium]
MSARPLAPEALRRLQYVCGMLGSAHDGERAAAAATADRMVREAGLTWRDVIAPVPFPPAAEPRAPTHEAPRSAAEWHALVLDLIADPPRLYPAEDRFMHDMERRTRRGARPTARQAAWLEKIARRGA